MGAEVKKIVEVGLQGLTMLVALFYAFRFLFAKSSQRKSTNFLVILFFGLSYLEIFTLSVDNLVGTELGIYQAPLFAAVAITFAPTVYLYIRSIILTSTKKSILNHYLPAIIVLVLDIALIFIARNTEKDSSISQMAYYGTWGVTIGSLAVIFIFQSVFYSIKSFRLINLHVKEVGEVVSFEEEVNLKWTKIFLFGYLFFFVGSVGSHFIGELLDSFLFEFAFDGVLLGYVLYIGINGSKQLNVQDTIQELSTIITEEKEEHKAIEEAELQNEADNQDSKAVEDKFLILKNKLEVLMQEKKPFLDTSLTIFDLSKQLDTNYKYLSKAINNHFNVNFATYVNSHRIEEAKLKLKDPDTQYYKIEAIAEMVGFKSKSAFNGAFKNMVGKTPSQYRDQS